MEQTTAHLSAILNAANSSVTQDQAGAEIARLQRALLRLAFAFHGNNPELDQVLARLSNTLRSGDRNTGIAQLIDEVVAIVTKPDADSNCLSINTAAIKRGFESFLSALAPPRDDALVRSLMETRARIQQAREEAQLLALIEQTAQRLSQDLARPADRGSDPQGAEVCRTSLLELLERVTFPADLDGRAKALRASLSQPRAPAEIHRAAQTVADLLKAAHVHARHEIDRLGGFLKQVVAKVDLLQQQLLLANNSQKESLRESEALSQSVSGHVQEIQSNVATADSIDTLRTSVAENLQLINQDVDTFVETERQRNAQTEQLFAKLTTQLQALERETNKLREGMAKERVRATTDPLTGVANRLAFETQVAYEFERWHRGGGALSVIVIDIDHFKSVNDTYGHQTGDRVLKTVADQLRLQLRQCDFLARYGGEEFVVLLPNTPLPNAGFVAEKLRKHIAGCHFHYRDQQVPVTISQGLASFRDDTPDAVFERADQALYRAKNSGRNRFSTEEEPATAEELEAEA